MKCFSKNKIKIFLDSKEQSNLEEDPQPSHRHFWRCMEENLNRTQLRALDIILGVCTLLRMCVSKGLDDQAESCSLEGIYLLLAFWYHLFHHRCQQLCWLLKKAEPIQPAQEKTLVKMMTTLVLYSKDECSLLERYYWWCFWYRWCFFYEYVYWKLRFFFYLLIQIQLNY